MCKNYCYAYLIPLYSYLFFLYNTRMKLRFLEKYHEADDVYSFLFKAQEPLAWRAGQYLPYTLEHENVDERGTKRFFSIASAPFEKHIRITARINPEKRSSFKQALFNLQQGQTLEAQGPHGNFVIDDPSQQYVFLAGGIGITAFRPILLDLDHQSLPINVQLLYANRNQNFVYKKELDELAQKYPTLKIHYLVEPERIDKETVQRLVPDLTKPVFYVSGPLPLVNAMEQMLAALGVPDTHIKEDHFPGYQE